MNIENSYLPENKQETIKTITLAEYGTLPSEVLEWLHMNEDVPDSMWKELVATDASMHLIDVLHKIRQVRAEVCDNGKPNRPVSFEDSRFTSFEDALKRNLNSCGVRVRVFGTILRKLGVPVRFVDGQHVGDEGIVDHAWLDIYSPKDGLWIECDPGEQDFEQSDRNKRGRIFHDWDELKAIHVKRSGG